MSILHSQLVTLPLVLLTTPFCFSLLVCVFQFQWLSTNPPYKLWEPVPANKLTQAKCMIPALHEMAESQINLVKKVEHPKARVTQIYFSQELQSE